ncbi:NAD(P)-dependent oxidoreductase [Xylophilus sp. GOD-11R]|uniref:NAD(P)-dependent oxidoreductase n=1 Tax=Xylophilus sp. GOD-11R TaxID=3089814 RepID=UPI00298C1E87|nr:NAD(P)-dependent oxidoreductase [Xylophilus sp. GOD-11R]WPB58296.1 NAD(P)-dependent oxidoreductase [Xylophilus sp. GOD-11R]
MEVIASASGRKRVGMIGVGLMGHGIAANIVGKGWPLSVLEHAGNQPLDDLLAAGARTCATPAQLAARSDIVVLCVSGTPQVEAVLLGEGGVLQGLAAGSVVIDCSTAVPASTEKLAAAVEQAGSRFLDAAMTRTPKEAAEGRLNLLVGADASLLAEVRPLLECFAENIFHAGPPGAGHRMKLLHNFVSLGTVALMSEAAACAQRAGIDPAVFVDVLGKGGGGGAALERLKPYLLGGETAQMKFSIANAAKDLGYYNTMADNGGAAHGIAAAVGATLDALAAAGLGTSFLPELPALLLRDGEPQAQVSAVAKRRIA